MFGEPGPLDVVVVDDHALSVHALAAVLRRAGHSVVGAAADGDAGVEAITRLRPEVAIVDLTLPGISGLEVVRAVSQLPGVRVLVHTGSIHARDIEEAIAAGAAGVSSKLSPLAAVTEAVAAVAAGRFHLDQQIEQALISGRPALTYREREMLQLIAHGLSLEEIARHLGLAPQAMYAQLALARRKLSARNRADAVVAAMRADATRMPEAS